MLSSARRRFDVVRPLVSALPGSETAVQWCFGGGVRCGSASRPPRPTIRTCASTNADRRGADSASRRGYNLSNFLCTLFLLGELESWALTAIHEKVVKIGAKVFAHARYTVFQMVAEGGDQSG